MTSQSLIALTLLNPAAAFDLSLAQWDLLIRQGRRANLLARLASMLRYGFSNRYLTCLFIAE